MVKEVGGWWRRGGHCSSWTFNFGSSLHIHFGIPCFSEREENSPPILDSPKFTTAQSLKELKGRINLLPGAKKLLTPMIMWENHSNVTWCFRGDWKNLCSTALVAWQLSQTRCWKQVRPQGTSQQAIPTSHSSTAAPAPSCYPCPLFHKKHSVRKQKQTVTDSEQQLENHLCWQIMHMVEQDHFAFWYWSQKQAVVLHHSGTR